MLESSLVSLASRFSIFRPHYQESNWENPLACVHPTLLSPPSISRQLLPVGTHNKVAHHQYIIQHFHSSGSCPLRIFIFTDHIQTGEHCRPVRWTESKRFHSVNPIATCWASDVSVLLLKCKIRSTFKLYVALDFHAYVSRTP